MGAAVTTLLHSLSIRPALLIGHSAGAAIAVRMALDGLVVPTGIVSLNGALLPFGPLQGLMFAPMAKALALLPFAPRLFAWGARDRSAVERLIASTGSKLDDRGVELYWRLVRSPAHVAGVLQMMSQWHLDRLASELPQLQVPLALLVGARDRTVLPASAERVRELLPAATLTRFPGLGHLMHEERPERIAEAIFAQAQAWHV